jgi:hypothetical protein
MHTIKIKNASFLPYLLPFIIHQWPNRSTQNIVYTNRIVQSHTKVLLCAPRFRHRYDNYEMLTCEYKGYKFIWNFDRPNHYQTIYLPRFRWP